jgi:hypothetical protein
LTNFLSFRLAGLALMMDSASAPSGLKITEATKLPSHPIAFQRPSLAGTTIAEAKKFLADSGEVDAVKLDVRYPLWLVPNDFHGRAYIRFGLPSPVGGFALLKASLIERGS